MFYVCFFLTNVTSRTLFCRSHSRPMLSGSCLAPRTAVSSSGTPGRATPSSCFRATRTLSSRWRLALWAATLPLVRVTCALASGRTAGTIARHKTMPTRWTSALRADVFYSFFYVVSFSYTFQLGFSVLFISLPFFVSNLMYCLLFFITFSFVFPLLYRTPPFYR